MDSGSLACFVKVVSCGSIAEAARQLNMAPATLAQRIRTLESDVKCPLIQRSGRTVQPTAAGLRILDHAKDVLKSVNAIHASASNTELPPGPLRLGGTPTVVAGILPDVLTVWTAHHPGVDVFIQPAITRELYSALLTDSLDVAILPHPNFSLAKTFSWRALREEELVLLLPKGIDISNPLEAVTSHPFIRYDRQTVAGQMIDGYLRSRQLEVRSRFELDGIFPITEFVSRGLGVAIVPNSVVIDRIAPTLQRLPLPPPCPKRTIGALWLRSSPRARLTEAFVDVAVNSLSVPQG